LHWQFWKRKERSLPALVPEIAANLSEVAIGSAAKGLAQSVQSNPCLYCGACCAFFLVSFPDHEADTVPGGVVSSQMCGISANSRRFMHGTETKNPRCVALDGFIGTLVQCRIYQTRPSTCRTFKRSWEDGDGNFLCDRARAAYGLQVFSQY
jgi:hypothetical protein